MNTDWSSYFVFYLILNSVFMVFIGICNCTKLNTVRKIMHRKLRFKDKLVMSKLTFSVVHYLSLWIITNWFLVTLEYLC